MSRIFIAAVIIFSEGRRFSVPPRQTLSFPAIQQLHEIINQAAAYRHNKQPEQRGCFPAPGNSYSPASPRISACALTQRHRE
jgi:hypothetical protein